MESTMILSVSAVLGFAVYYELVEVSYLEPVTSNGMKVHYCHFNINITVTVSHTCSCRRTG